METTNIIPLAILLGALGAFSNAHAAEPIPTTATPRVIVNTQSEPVAPGPFVPTWDSLKQYQAPNGIPKSSWPFFPIHDEEIALGLKQR
jgi:hypothetical protein